jgi:hypothetical protein
MEDQIITTEPWPRLQTIHCHNSVCHLISHAQRRARTMQTFKAFLVILLIQCLWIHCQISFTQFYMGCNTCLLPPHAPHLICSQCRQLLITLILLKLLVITTNFPFIINTYPQMLSQTRCSILKVILPTMLPISLWYIPITIQVSRNRYHPTWPMPRPRQARWHIH